MNRELIRRWNSRVKPNDFVIFLGDFAFRDAMKVEDFLLQLNGNITFIRGNHDNNNSLNTRIYSLVVEFPKGHEVFCIHRPNDFSSSYDINLVGHVHEKWKIMKIYSSYLVNVGVDVWKFSPVSIEEILKHISDFKRIEKNG